MYHVPIMKNEIIDALRVEPNGIYLDGTIGGGGHSEQILLCGGRVLGIDRDDDAIDECKRRLERFGDKLRLKKENFKNVAAYLDEIDGGALDGALLDLGISSHQIDCADRGMSYRLDVLLDMRMDRTQFLNARTVLNEYSEQELVRILFDYGQEPFAKRIAKNIVRFRQDEPIETTGQLTEIVRRSVKGWEPNPQKRTFQAIRIEVNNELRGLDAAINEIFSLLKRGARFCIISFHSLEDRIVKQTFSRLCEDCVCPKSLPKCVCGHKARGKLIGRFKPTKAESEENSRSLSATLRIIEKL